MICTWGPEIRPSHIIFHGELTACTLLSVLLIFFLFLSFSLDFSKGFRMKHIMELVFLCCKLSLPLSS